MKQRTEFFCTLSSALRVKGDAYDLTQADHNRPCWVRTYRVASFSAGDGVHSKCSYSEALNK